MLCLFDKDSDFCHAVHFLTTAKGKKEMLCLTQAGTVPIPIACLHFSMCVLQVSG